MKKILAILAIIVLIAALALAYSYYSIVLKPNTKVLKQVDFYIKTGSNYQDLLDNLSKNDILKSNQSFQTLATKMNLPNHIYPGRYILKPKTNNQDLIKQFRSGTQKPVKVVFNKERTLADLAQNVSKQIEMDSTSFMNLVFDSSFLAKNKQTKQTIIGSFIPDTYEFYWNTDAKKFVSKMQKAHQKFWTKEKLALLKKANLTKNQAQTIASIVAEETNKTSEMQRIAGVYLNRIKKGWKLEADPTVKFGIGDFTIKRILREHLKYDSPYNTYKYKGIPPGPICTANKKEIEAVLNAENHNYMYFCAKEDFSGFHNFATNLKEHNKNAKLYHKALNQKRIFK